MLCSKNLTPWPLTPVLIFKVKGQGHRVILNFQNLYTAKCFRFTYLFVASYSLLYKFVYVYLYWSGCIMFLPSPLDLWPWKPIGLQTLLRTRNVPNLVKIHWRILILECSQGCYAVKSWPCDIDLWPCNILQWIVTKLGTYLVPRRVWNPIGFQGQRSRSPGQIFRRGDTPRFA
jgi:hypothetical protein